MKLKIVRGSECTGCHICELVCNAAHEGTYDVRCARLHVRSTRSGPRPTICTQCLKCIKVCPTEALSVDGDIGFVSLDPSRCNGCGDCAEACPFDVIRMDGEGMPVICDLCGGNPECEEWCPREVFQSVQAR